MGVEMRGGGVPNLEHPLPVFDAGTGYEALPDLITNHRIKTDS